MEIRKLIRQLIKEELSTLPLINSKKKYEFSYEEINLINRDLEQLNSFLYSQTNNSPDLADKKMRLKRIIKIIDKKLLQYKQNKY